jgi:D-cysteine desulfhydrase
MKISDRIASFPRLDLVGAATPLQKLDRVSRMLGRDIYIKRDDTTPLAFGGNKLRKLEFLTADAQRLGADTLVTAGAIQSNHVRQTAAVAAQLGMRCHALLENPTDTTDIDYLHSGNRLLLDLFDAHGEPVAALHNADAQLQSLADRLRGEGHKPYVIPIGGSNPLGALGYVHAGLELAQQAEAMDISFSAVVLASGSAGTHGGLALALAHAMPETQVIGVTVSRTVEAQAPKVAALIDGTADLLDVEVPPELRLELWDEYFLPRYGEPNKATIDAIRLLARTEGVLLDPVYTGKAMAGLLDGVTHERFDGNGPLLFLHTGGAPALFAYRDVLRAHPI